MYKSKWWTSPVWEVETGFSQEFNQAILAEVKQIADEISKGADIRESLWDYSSPSLDILKEYILAESSRVVSQDIEEYRQLNIKLKYCMGWVNVKGKGEAIEAHAHNDCSVTATYYLKTPEDCGDLVLLNTDPLIDDQGAFLFNQASVIPHRHIKPREGLLVIFPGYVVHEVQENRSDDRSISLSTDMQQVIDPQAPNAMVVKSWCDTWQRIK